LNVIGERAAVALWRKYDTLEARQEPNSGQIGSDRAAPKVAAE